MSRTKTPEQYEAEYNWLNTEQAAKRIGGMSTGFVLKMIHQGHLKPPRVLNVSRSGKARYRISPKAVDRFVQECEELVSSGS